MNYHDKKVGITGWTGFIGKALEKRLKDEGAQVVRLQGDVREGFTFKEVDYTFDYVFHFAAPSSQTLFKRKPSYCIDTTIRGAINGAKACARAGVRFVYPSTGLLSSDRFNEYAMCKKIIEDFVIGLGADSLGIRIFATYGPGEGHKADYASVPYLFARDMVEGKCPVIWGDGEQVRDFIYIDDTVNAILVLAEECPDKIVDVGSGVSVSFNHILEQLDKMFAKAPKPVYQDAPRGYVRETAADPTRMAQFYRPTTDLWDGLEAMVKSIKEGK